MRGQMKKTIISILFLIVVLLGGALQNSFGQQDEGFLKSTRPEDSKQIFIQNLIQSLSSQAANLAFDYQLRPVIGVLVADFTDPSGEEIALGNEIASGLRATLNRGQQFHVYGREHPVCQRLRLELAKDRQWTSVSQRLFKKALVQEFSGSPVDLIIIGQVKKTTETGNQLKIEVSLIPFYKSITRVEGETGRIDILKQQFLSPALPPQEMTQALTVIKTPIIPKGRLIVISLINPERIKELSLQSRPPRQTPSAPKDNVVMHEANWKVGSLREIDCWVDEKECSTIQNWLDGRKKEYINILSGLGADTIWFDEWVTEGPHSFFLSLAQDASKNRYKTFSNSFSIKGGTSNYLFFFFQKDPLGDPKLQIQLITDPQNRSWAF